MASSQLQPYKDNTTQVTFVLVSTSATGATYQVSGGTLAEPFRIEIVRKIGPTSQVGNDHVIVRFTRSLRNATTGKLSTCTISVDIGIPKDTSLFTATVMKETLALVASLLNDNAANAATSVNRTALIEGRDL